jgi:hypothetical protein
MHENIRFRVDRVMAAVIFATGITLAGYFIGNSFLKTRLQDRYVTVKGLSEREVISDLAIWKITIKATGNDLSKVNNKITSDRNILTNFLVKQGFKEEEIEIGNYVVTDLLAQRYRDNSAKDFRYIINATTLLKTSNIDLVRKVTESRSLLVEKGIVIDDENGPFYEFTKFNDIKQAMLEEAIKNARKAANKFAEDSGNKLGLLRKASQGTFLIRPAIESEGDDEYSSRQAARMSIPKKIRLVTTIEYSLKD